MKRLGPKSAPEHSFVDAFMTSAQLAQVLGVSDRWVRKLAEQDGFGRKFGRSWVFTRDECEQLIEQRKQSSGWRKAS